MTATFKIVERDGWNDRAGVYSESTALATTQAIPTLLRAVRPRMGVHLLDICTGPGFAAGAAHAIGCEVTGIDFAPEMVAVARQSFPGCSFMVGDAEALDLPSNNFDAVVCNFGVFHFGEPEKAFAEAFRVTRPGGRYSWSQWFGPDRSEFFSLVFKAVMQNANMNVGLPPAPPPFRFSESAVAIAAMREAGFDEIGIDEVPILLHAPAKGFMDFFRKFSVRVMMVIERQEPEVQRTIVTAIEGGLKPYARGEQVVLPAPAMVVSGRKPG